MSCKNANQWWVDISKIFVSQHRTENEQSTEKKSATAGLYDYVSLRYDQDALRTSLHHIASRSASASASASSTPMHTHGKICAILCMTRILLLNNSVMSSLDKLNNI
ncbi:hypothetical protein LOAG_06619 [Loa loa]|uniref:Uncharacterized protein n=1 Tax=Loa loa TaxID=7209 RepID=A0A1S0TZA4_LOALO|nr:hypothetical protein LOAG_06619 [Loa loa]EFO21870.1 hypothetical protein LOAG_06619 [Loa loa]